MLPETAKVLACVGSNAVVRRGSEHVIATLIRVYIWLDCHPTQFGLMPIREVERRANQKPEYVRFHTSGWHVSLIFGGARIVASDVLFRNATFDFSARAQAAMDVLR